VPRSAGKPAIYRAVWGLFAVGALLALVLLALLRASPRLQPPEALATGRKLRHHPSSSRATTSNATLSGSVLRAVRNRRGSARLLDLP
jgi:hypothetical protein